MHSQQPTEYRFLFKSLMKSNNFWVVLESTCIRVGPGYLLTCYLVLNPKDKYTYLLKIAKAHHKNLRSISTDLSLKGKCESITRVCSHQNLKMSEFCMSLR